MNRPQISDDTVLSERRLLRFGLMVIILGLTGFLLWAIFAPLDKGIASSGFVTVAGNRKVIQSPQGGVIRSILVAEGQEVSAGEPLIELDQVETSAQVDTLRSQYEQARVTEIRLLAERDGASDVTYPADMTNDAQLRPLITLQKSIFHARTDALKNEINALKSLLAGSQFQLDGLRQTLESKRLQQRSLREQTVNFKSLAEEGYLPRNRYLEMQRQLAETEGIIADTKGQIGQLKQKIQETGQRIAQKRADYQHEVSSQLSQTQNDKLATQNKLKAATYALNNTTLVSPVKGRVIGLNTFTLGGVVATGQQLMEILPTDTPLIVEARLQVDLMDKVQPQLPVDIMFTAFNQSTTPKIPGQVSLISADRLSDPATGEPYFQLQITVLPEGRKMLGGLAIKPGMPVDVFVKTGSRSLFSYLFKPLADRVSTSLAEE